MTRSRWTRRRLVGGLAGLVPAAAAVAAASETGHDMRRAVYGARIEEPPTAPIPALTRHDLVATEIASWNVPEANQAVAVDPLHFYGIGNHTIVKYRRSDGARVAEWFGPRGGPIVHFNAGYVSGRRLVLAHSNFPQLPMASSIETFDTRRLEPVASHSLGIRLGSLTWAVRHRGWWWACFANYNDAGTTPGFDQRWTHVAQFDNAWQLRQSWLFPPQIVARWGDSACSGGDWGDDGMLYVTGHDARELYVLRLPRQGVTLEYVTTIDVPFEGQAWAWDRSRPRERIIYGIRRSKREVIAARIPPLPVSLRSL